MDLVASSLQPDKDVVCSALDGMQSNLHPIQINGMSMHNESASSAIAAAAAKYIKT